MQSVSKTTFRHTTLLCFMLNVGMCQTTTAAMTWMNMMRKTIAIG